VSSLTVVIASRNAPGPLAACLSALEPQACGRAALQVIVADSSTDGTAQLVGERYPWVRLLQFDEPLTVPELRGRAIAAADSSIIAVLDPYSVPAPDWAERVLAAHATHAYLVIGGAVDLHEPESRRYAAWALYFNEYGLFMPPVVEGETWIVAGSNVSYKRAALFDGLTPRYPVFWKTFANEDAEAAGSPLWLDPGIVVSLNKPIPTADYLRTRYHHGRCFASMRVAGRPAFERLGRFLTAPLLPLILVARWSRGILPKRRHRLRFIATLPLQVAFFSSWAWGELCGYALGAGHACRRLHY
jgi:glycosyltransferase involved in cell wall biosynthesis